MMKQATQPMMRVLREHLHTCEMSSLISWYDPFSDSSKKPLSYLSELLPIHTIKYDQTSMPNHPE